MAERIKIFIIVFISLIFAIAYAQTKSAVEDTSKKSRDSSAQKVETKNDNEGDDLIGGFIRSLLGESGSGDSDTSKKYDYFSDKNGDGVDDRLDEKNSSKTTKSSTTNKTKKTSSSSKSSKSSTVRTKSIKRRGK